MKYLIKNKLALVGDVHGRIITTTAAVTEASRADEEFDVLLLGDIGLGFGGRERGDDMFLDTLNAYMAGLRNAGKAYMLRGNHDNPEVWERDNTNWPYDRVVLLKDYDELVLPDGKCCLVVGGGVSLDKVRRIEGASWWPGERVQLTARLSELPEYHVVFAHTGPEPPGLNSDILNFFAKTYPGDLHADIREERERVQAIMEQVKPKLWVNGHYHHHASFQQGDTEVRALDIGEWVFVDALL